MSKAWGGVGAWALDAERAEAEERERGAAEEPKNPVLAGEPTQSFPTLREATSTKSKKKKSTTMSLAEFNSGSSSQTQGPTHDELLRLPTAPRERSSEEIQHGRLVGGFRSYGYGAGGGRDDGDRRRGSPPGRGSDFDQPSRADEVDNWASVKKPTVSFGPGRQDRHGSLGGGGGGPSRADDVDNWSAVKKPLPTRQSGFGSGFRDSSSAASDSDRWVRAGAGGGGWSGFSNNGERERPRLVLDPPKGSVGAPSEAPASTRPSPFGAARPREEVLAEKGVDPNKMDLEIEAKKTSRPTSAQSSRPSSAQSSRPGSPGSQVATAGTVEGAGKPRQKVNPFGDAKPREVLLQEKGQDWRKIDRELEHRGVDRPETPEEKLLKEEIIDLKKKLAKENESSVTGKPAQFSPEELAGLQEQIVQRERDLEMLIREMDDRVRFGQRATGSVRPGSGSGRRPTSLDRPSSQSGRSEESQSLDFSERPRSRGDMGNAWSKPMEERRGYQGGRESSFVGRSMDRLTSRERW